METFVALLALSALSLLAFGATGAALAGLRGTCSRACDRQGRPLCEGCPRRDAAPPAPSQDTGSESPRGETR